MQTKSEPITGKQPTFRYKCSQELTNADVGKFTTLVGSQQCASWVILIVIPQIRDISEIVIYVAREVSNTYMMQMSLRSRRSLKTSQECLCLLHETHKMLFPRLHFKI